MALIHCKSCKKEVAHNAPTCPHCGVKNPGVTTRQMIFGLAGLIATVLVIAASCSDDKDETAVTQSPTTVAVSTDAQTQAPVKGLDITPEEFRKSYNTLIGQVDKSWRVAEFDITQGAVNDTFTAKLSESAGMVGTVDKASKKLISVMVIAGGGQDKNNMQSIAVVLTTAHVLTQGASKEEISNVVSTLVTDALNGIEKTDTPMQSRVVGNRKLSATASPITGLMFAVSNPN
jgi:alkylhydroperoxidase/carboxymuconolactone decarboxylase family protein YurZ